MIRLVRAKPATKRKSSLDTLIEVVQKELLRVNEQPSTISPPSSPPHHYSQIRSFSSSKVPNRILTSRSIMSSVLPTSHSFKLTRKRGIHEFKNASSHQRTRSYNDEDEHNLYKQSMDDYQSESENIDDIVRETIDRIVSIVVVNQAPFVVNMLTTVPDNDTCINTESKILTNTFGTNVSQFIIIR